MSWYWSRLEAPSLGLETWSLGHSPDLETLCLESTCWLVSGWPYQNPSGNSTWKERS